MIAVLAGAAAAPAQGRTPVPDAAAQAKARDLVHEVYGDAYDAAKTSAQRTALAKKMLDEAARTEGDSAGHYVLLRIARDMAAAAGDVVVALEAVERIVRAFDVDPLQAKLDCLEAVAQAASSSSQHRSLAQQAFSLIDLAVAEDDLEAASKLGEIARKSATRAREYALVKQVVARMKAVKESKQAYEEYQKALIRLEDNPIDPEANLSVGRYLCLTKGDWDRGVPMLALGADAELKAVAVQELQAADEQAALGHAWWDLAEKEEEGAIRDSLVARAAYWYTRALPGSSGLAKARLEARLRDLSDAVLSRLNRQLGKPASGKDPQTSEAVALGLQWLAGRQREDGSWSFADGPRAGSVAKAPGAATAMALVPFLREGHTHQDGLHKDVVSRGLTYLGRSMKVSPNGASLVEPGATTYGHALATIALCEAYARTRDRRLRDPAQGAVTFTIYAQDPKGGGWRYQPRQAGDTSVTGWQLTALRIAGDAGLRVPPASFAGVDHFLNSVQADGGAHYGYTSPGRAEATTAIGLLCRLHLGWEKGNPALRRGVEWIGQNGPSINNLYYSYYATELMRCWGGDLWDDWKPVIRESLFNSQTKTGEEAGGWSLRSRYADRGGSLYCTVMAIMILQACNE
jgi:hypothetical protein